MMEAIARVLLYVKTSDLLAGKELFSASCIRYLKLSQCILA